MERRKRRSFNAEFKAEAVRLVRDGGKSVPHVAKETRLRKDIEVFYNRQRRHWTLGDVSPVDFELAALPQKLAA